MIRDIPWQVRERHENETFALLKELGFTDSKGRIRKFSGAVWWPKYAELGHDKMNIEECSCARKTR